MGWKRIMSNRGKKEPEDTTGRETECSFLQQYLDSLLPELNFRMIMDLQDLSSQALWVEKVIITAYEPVPVHRSRRRRGMMVRFFLHLFQREAKKERR